jgi:dihydrodipicolinate synthase/N-acetylneuraminate lyase
MAMEWTGVLPAMTTPFDPAMQVDHAFLAQHAAWQLGNGCAGLVMLGSLGEGATLEHEARCGWQRRRSRRAAAG